MRSGFRMRAGGPCSFAFSLLLATFPAKANAPCTDVALVLAMDASGSMSEADFALQMQATAAALQDPQVLSAIASVGGIALAAIIWADEAEGIRQLGWTYVDDAESAAHMGALLSETLRGGGGNTDMGQGIYAALDLLEHTVPCASRRIINVSGDGRETPGARGRPAVSVLAARERADAEGVVINGLAIEAGDTGLRDWYERRVITGPGSFAMSVGTLADFGAAMRLKLKREIRDPALAYDQGPPPLPDAGRAVPHFGVMPPT